ncbi:MAG: amino acid ABC transporter substrate-binding protein [Alphaproteobacteria bacterium]|jgi:branched-chain amino acid transport system substrate-binding protein|nr:amino acid ABC transporter substrate-binding protein [Alphaproteobacteria bacterium]
MLVKKARLFGIAMAAATAATMVLSDLASAQDTIRVGMTVSSTGRFALAAQAGARGAKIWVDDVNSRGGIEIGGKKRKVELVELDDRSDKQMVARVYENLIKEHDVDVLLGPFGSTLTSAAAHVTEKHGKFLIIWSASSDAIYEQGYNFVVSGSQIAASLLGAPAVKLIDSVGVKKVAFAYLDEPFPAGMAKGAAKLAKKLGMEVTMMEKFAKGTKDFSIMFQKARASGAQALYPVGYEGDQMAMARQLREMNLDFPLVYMVYASQKQFLAIGEDADYIYSQTLMHPKVNWPVTDGLNREQVVARYNKLFPDAAYPADFQTALAYSACAVLEKVMTTAQSLEPAKLKQAAVSLSGKITVMTGPYQILDNGKQIKMEFVIMQNHKNGPQVVWPPEIRTAEPIFPVPKFSER